MGSIKKINKEEKRKKKRKRHGMRHDSRDTENWKGSKEGQAIPFQK